MTVIGRLANRPTLVRRSVGLVWGHKHFHWFVALGDDLRCYDLLSYPDLGVHR